MKNIVKFCVANIFVYFWFHTIKPGRIDEKQAPHVNVVVFMRGLPTHAYTRIYFAEETQASRSSNTATLEWT